MDCVHKPQNYKGLHGILQLLQGFHLNNFPLKLLDLAGSFSFSSFSVGMFRFSSNQYKKLVPVPLTFCNGLLKCCRRTKLIMRAINKSLSYIPNPSVPKRLR